MKLPIRFRPKVAKDLTDASDWYDAQRPGLGRGFAEEALAVIDVIAERPESFPIVHQDVSRALMKRFPYAIYFRVEQSAVVVLVIVHTARSSRVWKQRLK